MSLVSLFDYMGPFSVKLGRLTEPLKIDKIPGFSVGPAVSGPAG
jgi:hypothetical protein